MRDKMKNMATVIAAFIAVLLLQSLTLSACGTPRQAETPTLTETSSAVLIPDAGGMIGSGNTAGANSEAVNIKTAARTYLLENPDAVNITSDALSPLYITPKPRAQYYINAVKGTITRVDTVSGGWAAIIFRLSDQKWVKGVPDNNHINDQDIP
jgi:predicted small secreted protein